VKGEPSAGWFPQEKISVEEALKAYTWGSAYASFEEHLKGTITAGKLADLAVLDTNLLRAQPAEWLDAQGNVKVKTLYTIVGGRIVHARE
jgi:hypothetical protein